MDGTSLCIQVNVDCSSSLDKLHQLFSVANGKRQFHPMPQYNQDTNVIGLDPGQFVTTDSLDNSTSCSNKEWHHISGANHHLRKKKFCVINKHTISFL